MANAKQSAFRQTHSVTDEDIEADLWPEQDGAPDREQLYRHYQLYLESAHQISARRAAANSYFLTINTSAASLVGILASTSLMTNRNAVSIVLVVLIILCLAWMIILRSYRTLNSAKFRVIGLMEKRLAAAPFLAEWTALCKGKSIRVHMPLTPTETLVPIAFTILYLAMMLMF